MNRRSFLAGTAATGAIVSAPLVKSGYAKNSPNDQINVAVVGLNGRGKAHIRYLSGIKGVKITHICDVDQNMLDQGVDQVFDVTGEEPTPVVDFRDMMDNKDIHAVTLATPDHWHALHTIWACQAGKDVYVEKPLSYCIREGRKMIEAAQKYQRIVQVGTNHVSNPVVQEGIQLARNGAIGDIYMGRVVIFGRRSTIGRLPNGEVPDGVNWDLFLGPAPKRSYNENRYHYKWHWFWDTSTTEFGNNGVHYMDMVRRALNKQVHPIQVNCDGGYYIHDSDQEVPNLQSATYKYDDGIMLEMEVRSWYTNLENGQIDGAFLYGSDGWMQLSNAGYKTYEQDSQKPDLSRSKDSKEKHNALSHFENFIQCVRSRRSQDLAAGVEQGHLSTTISHLGNIAYRTNRKLKFKPKAETFVNDVDADKYLTRKYREPFVVPDKV
jgi:predicted dehydrogenase